MSLTEVRSQERAASAQKVTVRTLLEKKRQRRPITALTAYDYPTARLVDEAGIDLVLVGEDCHALAVRAHVRAGTPSGERAYAAALYRARHALHADRARGDGPLRLGRVG